MDLAQIIEELDAEDRPTVVGRPPVVRVSDDTPFDVIVDDVDKEDTVALYRPDDYGTDTRPLEAHRDGHTSFYYFVGYFSPTVDGASSLRRSECLEDAPIHRIALSYRQAQYLDLIK